MSFEKRSNFRLQAALNISPLIFPHQGPDVGLREWEYSIRMDPKIGKVQVSAKCFRIPSFRFGIAIPKLGKGKRVKHLLK